MSARNHVLDLDGDRFAMPPRHAAECGNLARDNDCPRTPAVGAVLANVRWWSGTPAGHHWADPQFVQVAAVLQFPDWAWIREWAEHHLGITNAVPGGWAIRVEPAACPECGFSVYAIDCPLCERPPVIEGEALNQ